MSISPPHTRLLLDERPLQILPGLATAIGLNESIVLQQIHYWMMSTKSGEYHEGKKWVYNTYEQWHENFPFWSVMTIRRIIGKLEEAGLIETTDKFNRDTRDRTKWYTINYGHDKLTSGVINMNNSDCSDRTGHLINMNKSSVEHRLPTETTTDTHAASDDAESITPSVDDLFESFWQAYPRAANPTRHSKKESLAKFKVALKKAPVEDIMDALAWFKVQHDWTKDNGEWIPGAQKWLNQGMWEAAKDQVSKQRSDIPDTLTGTDRFNYERQKWIEANPEEAQRKGML